MAAPMKSVVWNLRRPILGNIHKLYVKKQFVPAANFCEEAVGHKRRLKFDVTSLDAAENFDPRVSGEEHMTQKEPESFATMFRKSKFVQLGELKDRMVAGRIFNVVNDDLYIDFGAKFYCVCSRPSVQADQYVKGQRVRIMVHKFEMSSSFLGSDQHITLLEADATLLGLFDQTPYDKGDKIVSKDTTVSGGFASKMMSKEAGSSDKEETVQDSEENIETVTVNSNTVPAGTDNAEAVKIDDSLKPQ